MCDQQRLRSACAYAQSDQSICWSLKYSMTVKLLTKHHLEFLGLKEGCTGSPESTLVKMPHCWKSHVAAHFLFLTMCVTYPEGIIRFNFNTAESFCLVCGLMSQSTAMVMLRWSVHQTTLFLGKLTLHSFACK